MDYEAGRLYCSPATIWVLKLEDRGRPRETAVGVVDVSTEILADHLVNASQKYCGLCKPPRRDKCLLQMNSERCATDEDISAL
jgi:hypothetical protein